MTDLETLRSALREPPAEGFAEPDLGAIMTKGRRIRRRRRLATGAGGVAATVVTVLVIVGAVALKKPPPPAQQPLPPAASAPSSSALPPAPQPTITKAPSTSVPLGNIISLETKSEGGREMVLYASALDEPDLPGVEFGLRVAYRNDDGSYDDLMISNEYKKSDRSFGFHAVDGGDVIRGTFVPVFGYFAGSATRITSTVRGKPVEAKVVPWSEDPTVSIFWFDGSQVESAGVLTPLVAYDARGQRLTK
ncbi:hypothetical protein [Amycolatopsis decaplanina]|uniref:Uncharacterized protein n=1 Tax=Amycolatopsis decaplanina DSM 44594 TaxID=1284240 RepID=M2YYM2_9PSEU|nr:hypothetical protein [Amycolatopsis decaplanina]EME60037.1 hypothetical protein H074_13457 [Amycolatopsis decaplanina DSM 44594]